MADCFETFPFPEPDPRAVIPALETIGKELDDARKAHMQDPRVWVGLTELYNRLKDPENDEPRILALRTLHEDLDRAVLRAYGRDDLAELAEPLPPFCIATDADRRSLERFDDEVIDRLFVLNEQRAKEETATAARTAKPPKHKPAKKRAKKPGPSPEQVPLRGVDDE